MRGWLIEACAVKPIPVRGGPGSAAGALRGWLIEACAVESGPLTGGRGSAVAASPGWLTLVGAARYEVEEDWWSM